MPLVTSHAGLETLHTLFWHFASEVMEQPGEAPVARNKRHALQNTLVTSQTDTDQLATQLATSLGDPAVTAKLPQIKRDFADVLHTLTLGTTTTNTRFIDAAHEYFTSR